MIVSDGFGIIVSVLLCVFCFFFFIGSWSMFGNVFSLSGERLVMVFS